MNVDGRYPYDGPHTADAVLGAARDVSDLIRYLNNATRTVALQPADLATAVGSVHDTVTRLPQLLNQLADVAARNTNLPGMYDHRGGDPAAVTNLLVGHLLSAAQTVPCVAADLDGAREHAARLGTREVGL